ncbi:MAG: ribosome-associated translation inhibitor RaiA [Clostridiales bacterium]|jgi:putative sigma-54 modulation protein|nr:ribosome-associated translation inhibitor RaiA [Clostridiales bacterium]
MKFSFTGKNTVVSDALKDKTAQKIGRLARLLPEEAEIFVTFDVTKLENKIEVTIPLHKRVLRAEVSTQDMYASLDEVVDVLERQMVKYKSRLKNKSRRDASFKDEFKSAFPAMEEAEDEVNETVIQKTKRFALKPMDSDEAVMEMELLGHDFFVFRNGETDDVNVVYRRKNGTYGLIEPEY